MYYCFSCGRGGGIIQYLQDYEGLSFDEAVQKACRLANADLSSMCYSPTVKFLKKIRKLRKKLIPFEHKILEEKELVTKTPDINKRKIFKINITEKGKQAYDLVLPTVLEHWQNTVEGVTDEELISCLKVLNKIKINLEEKLNMQI